VLFVIDLVRQLLRGFLGFVMVALLAEHLNDLLLYELADDLAVSEARSPRFVAAAGAQLAAAASVDHAGESVGCSRPVPCEAVFISVGSSRSGASSGSAPSRRHP
jgi:hypothetical protein